jgi:hypothetical protein
MLTMMMLLSFMGAHGDPVDESIPVPITQSEPLRPPPAPHETWSDAQVFAAQTGIAFTGLVATTVLAGIVAVGAGPFGGLGSFIILAGATIGVPYLAVSVGDNNGDGRGELMLSVLAYGVGVLTIVTGASAVSAAFGQPAPPDVMTSGVAFIGCGAVIATFGVPAAYALTAQPAE